MLWRYRLRGGSVNGSLLRSEPSHRAGMTINKAAKQRAFTCGVGDALIHRYPDGRTQDVTVVQVGRVYGYAVPEGSADQTWNRVRFDLDTGYVGYRESIGTAEHFEQMAEAALLVRAIRKATEYGQIDRFPLDTLREVARALGLDLKSAEQADQTEPEAK